MYCYICLVSTIQSQCGCVLFDIFGGGLHFFLIKRLFVYKEYISTNNKTIHLIWRKVNYGQNFHLLGNLCISVIHFTVWVELIQWSFKKSWHLKCISFFLLPTWSLRQEFLYCVIGKVTQNKIIYEKYSIRRIDEVSSPVDQPEPLFFFFFG